MLRGALTVVAILLFAPVAGRAQLPQPPVPTLVLCNANRGDWRVATHAVGDAAIDLVLDAYEKANAEQSIAGKRWSIEPGKLADLVVLNEDEDPLTCLEPRLRDAQVMMTIVGGKTVFER